MDTFVLTNTHSDFYGFQKFITFYTVAKKSTFDVIPISIQNWFSANLCAVLGGVLDLLIGNFNTVKFEAFSNDVQTIIQKNGFLSYYGLETKEDYFNTTIPYQKLSPDDGRYFNEYIYLNLLNRSEFVQMSQKLKKNIAESIYEIFVNTKIHSKSKRVYTCGQFYPKKNIIEFTIVDTGIGFKQNFEKCFNVEVSSSQAILWSVKNGTSTKKGVSGGIGLARLCDFVKLNKGQIQIVSGDGFYFQDSNNCYVNTFKGEYPGSIINMQFRTDNDVKYNCDNYIKNDLF